MEQLKKFAYEAITPSKAEVVEVMQDGDASVAKAEQLSLEFQWVSGLVDDTKKVRECLSTLETAMPAKVLKGQKSSATR